MTVPIRSMGEDRNAREAARLAEKRADPLYLAVELASNAARMRAKRKRRRALALCWDCDKPRTDGVYCRKHYHQVKKRRG